MKNVNLILKRMLLISMFIFSVNVSSQITNEKHRNNASSGYRRIAQISVVLPSSNINKLTDETSNFRETNKKVDLEIEKFFESNYSSQYILVAKDSSILIRKDKLRNNPTPLGYSMSKSLVGITIGKALCDGKIHDIQDKISEYLPRLRGTSWGDSTVKNLLEMKSGAFKSDNSNMGWKEGVSNEMNIKNYQIELGNTVEDYFDQLERYDSKSYKPGVEYNYSNFDTTVLYLLIDSVSSEGFAKYFEKSIWNEAGTQNNGAWLQAKNSKQLGTYYGFSATPDDWVRLGLYVLAEREKDTCFGEYLRNASSEKVKVKIHTGSYGWQIWTNCIKGTDYFCFLGYGGQILLMSPKTKIVFYAHSYDWEILWKYNGITSIANDIYKSR
jgi:hypothetical protein